MLVHDNDGGRAEDGALAELLPIPCHPQWQSRQQWEQLCALMMMAAA
jgi:hypothetical protein